MIKIVIAGTNGLAQLLVGGCGHAVRVINTDGLQAHFVDSTTSNQFVIFSRRVSVTRLRLLG